MIIPVTTARALTMRQADQRASGGAWPYNTPIYTGIPPIFSALGAPPREIPPRVQHLIDLYRRHSLRGQKQARERVYQHIVAAGYARHYDRNGRTVWRPVKHKHR
jgi:hypothetical protein